MARTKMLFVCTGNSARSPMACPLLPREVRRSRWLLDDPARAEGSAEEVLKVFRASRDEIERRVRAFLAERDATPA